MKQPEEKRFCHEEELILEGVQYLQARLPVSPKIGIILGSGLGTYAEQPPMLLTEEYDQIPGFTRCSVEGHRGRFILGERQGIPVVLLQGRIHRYEGHPLHAVTRPVSILAGLGVTTLIVTCAAGTVSGMSPGSLMLVTDHLNLMGENPLVGGELREKNKDRFIEMADAYDSRLLMLAKEVGRSNQIPLLEGILAGVLGPTFETKAEAEMLRRLGAQAVTMSTVPEVIMARAHNMSVLALALITNESGRSADGSLGHQDVLVSAESKADMVGQLLDGLLNRVAIGLS